MDPSAAPADIVALARQRATARAEQDWATADRIKSRLEAAGWQVIDSGTAFELEPTRPADIIEDGQTFHGSVESVTSLLDEPDSRAATVVVVVRVGDVHEATLAALLEHSPAGTQVLVVTERSVVIQGTVDEIIRTAAPFSPGDAIAAALRRASGAIIIVLEPRQVPIGDIVTALRAALGDPSVAIAGSEGLRSVDLHRYQPAGSGDVTTLASGCYAFRRADAIARGPMDGRLGLPASFAAGWGLRLRDEGPDAQPRRAVAIDLPLQAHGEAAALTDAEARRARRDAYRISDQFRSCRWLAAELPPQGGLVGDGADGDDDDDAADERGHAEPA